MGIKAVKEAGGIVWAYLGPADKEPPLPDEGFFHVPVENVFVEVVAFPTNFTRAMEGVLDNTHVAILHKDSAPPDIAVQLAPRLELQETVYGFRYAILRENRAEDGEAYDAARITSFALPSTSAILPGSQPWMCCTVVMPDAIISKAE